MTTTARRSLLRRLSGHESPLRRLDWVLLSAVVMLTLIGTLLVWSATRPALLNTGRDPQIFLKKHLLTVAIGLGLAALVTALGYRLVRAYAPILYGASCVGLVLVLTPLGSTIKGHHSWIELGGGFQLQPSEFAKVGLVVVLAVLLGERRDAQAAQAAPRTRDIVAALALAALLAGLIMMQPDLGTTMVLAVVVLAMVAISGAPKRWLLTMVGGGVTGAVAAWRFHLLKPYQINRFIAFADPAADPKGAGYNAAQARIAVGSGGLAGQGLFRGQQTGGHFVPEQHTDFIFTVAGEELGFLGSALIVVLVGVVLWRGLRIAALCANGFGMLLAAGVVSWLAFQTFENIGMTIGIMPITGVPLPYISYGGSATLANMIAFGLLQAVHLRQRLFG
ncbi:rod shape-determining protein RodA [Actinoallomurus purpureus]|uniref:rod shape-determining protein RodA n=1 Tax=Actinoallomurus purpureus TaxID=478114 RepID=UPI002091F2BA|nr:rod shape-determining protein RodA [Actinoallomurus purpureus]MCO6009093.1 rod shape-determining protein RodA [Actinoallomurus purpureus]